MSQRIVSHPVQQWVQRAGLWQALRAGVGVFWREHAGALALYGLLSVGLSWPLVRYFTTEITGVGVDPLHNLWLLWHTQQAFLGNQLFFFAPDLYYPQGISLLTHGLGPVTGVLALPFWGWGAVAAHNGAVLVSLVLTGYGMYLLARGLGLGRGVALFAGSMLLASPMCLAGLFGHMTKVFLGALPLVLLTLHHALNPERSRWWVGGPGLALLLTLLHSGYQFVFAALSVACFTLVLGLSAERQMRRTIFLRAVMTAGGCLVVLGPLLGAIVLTSRDPALAVGTNFTAGDITDALVLFTPTLYNWWSGDRVVAIWQSYDVRPSVERAVSLSWVGLLLGVVGLLGSQRRVARYWVLFMLGCALLALGPTLRWFGTTTFTPLALPLPLPYLLVKELPGLEFMRASGRFMMVGFVGLAMAASFGLAWLTHCFPRYRHLLIAVAIGLVLLESWPRPFPHKPLPAAPAFYQQLASDPEHYGVFDLPLESPYPRDSYITGSAVYQVMQMTHGKGIAAGYLSRTYAKPPVLPMLMSTQIADDLPQFQVNGQPVNVFAHAQALLARNNYRYVVWHKTLYPEPVGEEAWLQAVFGEQPPLLDNDEVRVYAVQPVTETVTSTLSLELDTNWYSPGGKTWWWAQSPARLFVHSPAAQLARLHIRPHILYDPQAEGGVGKRGVLMVQAQDSSPISVTISTDETAIIPLRLVAGRQTITLALPAGNFRPSTYGSNDFRVLSFAIHRVNLETLDGLRLPGDILVNGQPQQRDPAYLMVTHGTGWYGFEPSHGVRWARSPASLFVYSPREQQVQLRLLPRWIYEPAVAGGIGQQGRLLVNANEDAAQPMLLQAGQVSMIELGLRAGWNTVTLMLEAGTFRPRDVLPQSTDERQLSVAVDYIDLVAP